MIHPHLYAGYNSWDVDGDELNSPGVNEPVWPAFLASLTVLPLFVVTPEMLAAFDQDSPDLIVANDEWEYMFPLPVPPLELGGRWPLLAIDPQSSRTVLKAEDDTLVIPGRSEAWVAAAHSQVQLVLSTGETIEVRERA